VKLIDNVRARLDAKNDCYVAELPSLTLKDVQIADTLVQEHERMLTDGFYAEVTLEYDPVVAQEKSGRPFRIAALRPIQMSNPRRPRDACCRPPNFTVAEWKDFLIRSVGLEPSALDDRPRRWCCFGWCPSSSATTTWSSSGREGPGRAISTSRSRPTPT
jgi:ATP-dependent Lon protease